MTDSQYSQPGPWLETAGQIRDAHGSLIAVVMASDTPVGGANARLIAAAPQQHDALLAVLHAPGFDGLDDATRNAVRAALVKATGAAA